MKKGFTLVELSIVLVIIGLLIGGILVAQSMQNTARIHGFLKQISDLDIAVSNFQAKYNSLPGDSKLLTPAGDGNGIIGAALNATSGFLYQWEVPNFYVHLSASGYDPQHVYTNTVATTYNANPATLNAPVSLIGIRGTSINVRGDATWPQAWMISNITLLTNANRSMYPPSYPGYTYPGDVNAVKYYDALAIDRKIDDGALGPQNGVWSVYQDPVSGAHTCFKTDNYCMLMIKILGFTGEK